MLATAEQFWDANSFPLQFVPYVRAALWPIVSKYGISWADALVIGGIAGAQFFGAKIPMTVKFGRCDSNIENPQVRVIKTSVGVFLLVWYE